MPILRLENAIKQIASRKGAALVGIASRHRLMDAPPSGDPRYLMPSAQSIVSFAIPYGKKALRGFFGKTDWRSFNLEKKKHTRCLYEIGDDLVDLLKGKGFDALTVEVNNNYRTETGAKDVSELVEMNPEFSHRYGAVAAGIGRLGWSGNVMTQQYGSAILLGTVITSAELESDPLLEKNPCDGCKMCAASCPVKMIHISRSVKINIAGMTEEIAEKRTNNCCWIGCDGYHSLSPGGRWSNWSPYRVPSPLPDQDKAMDVLCTQIRKADPDANPDDLNVYSNYREAYFDPDYLFVSVCAHCANVCWADREDRIENRKRLADSGIVILRTNGNRGVVDKDEDVVEVDTPFHLKVAMLRGEYEAARKGKIKIDGATAITLKDRMLLDHLKNQSEGPEL